MFISNDDYYCLGHADMQFGRYSRTSSRDRRVSLAGYVAFMGQKRNAWVLVRKLEGKMPLGRPRCRWEGNIKMYLRRIGWTGMNWTDLA
jgi:hypothetical protein